jgi:putative FmdB family regulatory protein
MPIYEFYCGPCHRIYSFLSRVVNTTAAPDCPRCGSQGLARRPSAFAISKGREEQAAGGPKDGLADFDESRLATLMEELGPEAEHLNEEDPRQAARLMRRVFDATGMPLGSGMEEAIRRMEAGEDPEKVEQELGDALDADPFSAGGERPQSTLKGLRRLLPPSVDTQLYEL